MCIVGIQKRDLKTDKRRMAPGTLHSHEPAQPGDQSALVGIETREPCEKRFRTKPRYAKTAGSRRKCRIIEFPAGKGHVLAYRIGINRAKRPVCRLEHHGGTGPTASADRSPPSGPIAGDLKTSVRANTDRRSELGADVSKTGDLRSRGPQTGQGPENR